jgi:anti-sigma B factor antagonist
MDSNHRMDLELEEVTSQDSHTHLRLAGRIDITGAGLIETKFNGYTAARKKHAIVDLSGVPFLASMGIRVFLSAAKALSRDGKLLVLFGAQPAVLKTLVVSGFGSSLPIVENHEEALEKIGVSDGH